MTTDTLINDILTREGGFKLDPVDRGGATNFGITSRNLGEWRRYGRPATRSEVEGMKVDEARAIYRYHYVTPFLAIPFDELRAQLVDFGVNSGTATAIRELQDLLGVPIDGILGPRTMTALDVVPWHLVNNGLVGARVRFLAGIVDRDASQLRFLHGWMRRATSFYIRRARMRRLLCVALLAIAARASAQDAIDLRAATIERSAGDVATWPITAAITSLTIGATDCAVDFDAKAGPAKWPSVPIPGWQGGTIQYTLWLVRVVNGQVYTGGGIEFWDGRVGGCGPAGAYIANWYYDSSWGPLHDAGELSPGERVGFFVTAGDARAKDVRSLTARSAVVAVPWPGGAGGSFTFGVAPPPPVVTPPQPILVPPSPPPPVPAPVSVPAPAPLPSTDLLGVSVQLAAIKAQLDVAAQELHTLKVEVETNWTRYVAPVLKYATAIAVGILAKWKL